MARRSREESREMRKERVRKRLRGTAERPRLTVYRSLRYTYAQLVSDDTGEVMAAASTKVVRAGDKSGQCVESAKELGKRIAEMAKEKNIAQVVFDRSGFLFHGRVKAVAEGAKEAGLQF